VRTGEPSAILTWTDEDFRTLLLRDPHLSQRIFSQILRTLVDKERALIDSLITAQRVRTYAK
jgi:CRP-like cAMP-binding protein